jgi:hypothetical protein
MGRFFRAQDAGQGVLHRLENLLLYSSFQQVANQSI